MGTTAAPAVPWDLYREIHKALRFALFGVTTQAGNTDADDAAAVARLLDEWRDVALVLRGHHGHEDDFCDPLIRRHAADLRDELETAHHDSDRRLVDLDTAAAAIRSASDEDRQAQLSAFHLDLADFVACYATHLRFEESRVMPALNAALDDETLAAVTNQIRGSVAPDQMCTYLRYMAPAMNFAERREMLAGMYAGAPPEIFEQFRAAVQGALVPEGYASLATAVGFS